MVVRQCPESVLIQNYIAAVREFCNRTRWLRTTILGVTVADTPQYAMGDDPNMEICGIRAMSIRASSATEWDPVTEQAGTLRDSSLSNEQPKYYQYLPHASFILSATPNAVYNLQITAVLQPKEGAVSIDSSLLVDWTEVFRSGALYHLLRIKDQPWTDERESGLQKTLFEAGVAQGLSAVAVGYNAGAAGTARFGQPDARPRSRVLPI
jgi:hypothetical protein